MYHELFLAFTGAGFNETQALYLTGIMIMNAVKSAQ